MDAVGKTTPREGTLQQEWTKFDNDRTALNKRCEEYAAWTLPYIFQEKHIREDDETRQSLVTIGARAVNHLANKIVETLFPKARPFFVIAASDEVMAEAAEVAGGDETTLAQIKAEMMVSLAAEEKSAMRRLNLVKFRPAATEVAKHLIITGNCLKYRDPDGTTQVYGLRDYVVQRDVAGNVVLIMTRDVKSYATFSEDVQALLKNGKRRRDYKDDTPVELITKIVLKADGKYHVRQSANEVDIPRKEVVYTKDDLPWIVLTWHRSRGDHYGRGAVEDHAALFHVLNELTVAYVEVMAVLADIKFFVHPSAEATPEELNKSARGTYHTGKEGDIHVPQILRGLDFQILAQTIEKYERELGAAFLLNSAMTRDAERVTTEEIRAQANELETGFGGIYSSLAGEWQAPLATRLLLEGDFKITVNGKAAFEPLVVTGMESLSRSGQLDNLRMFVADLSMLNNVPDDIRAAIHPTRFVQHVGENRQVDYSAFMKTDAEIAQERQDRIAEQQAILQSQADANAQGEIAKSAAQETA